MLLLPFTPSSCFPQFAILHLNRRFSLRLSPSIKTPHNQTIAMFRAVAPRLFTAVCVIGGGTMGGGIAQITGQAGINVTVIERSDELCGASQKTIEKSVARVAKKKHEGDAEKQKDFVAGIMKHIAFTTKVDPVARADLVVEAVTEEIGAKLETWKKFDPIAPKDCVFATNTSSLSVTEQAEATTRRALFGGLHFFSPVPMMKLVEIIKTKHASEETIRRLTDFAKKVGKTPVVATDTNGFIVNRLLVPYMFEACRLVERGVATVEDVDTAMKLGCGHPMGPFTLADSIGVDVMKLIGDAWHKQYPEDPLYKPSKLYDNLCAQGKLGRKTGEGFYKYQ